MSKPRIGIIVGSTRAARFADAPPLVISFYRTGIATAAFTRALWAA